MSHYDNRKFFKKGKIMVHDEYNCNSEDSFEEIRQYFRTYNKLDTIDYLSDIHDPSDSSNIVEVRFKNTRKSFYRNNYGLSLKKGDIIAVEAPMGHDIGMVSLTGYLAKRQFDRKIRDKDQYNFLSVYRKAHVGDLKRWKEAKAKEISLRNRAREIAKSMGMDMKISDAEFQGDNTKVTFYYLADGWIDFRDLIKYYAREFQVKIGMKQIGARQEAAMIGGFSSSGHELCGSLWKTEFETVKLSAAKIQELPFTGTKLLGPSGALKASLNYELDVYLEARREFPDKLPLLETSEGVYYPMKKDLLQRKVWYSESSNSMMSPVELPLKRILEIAEDNKKGKQPSLQPGSDTQSTQTDFSTGSSDILKDTGPEYMKHPVNKRLKRKKTNYHAK